MSIIEEALSAYVNGNLPMEHWQRIDALIQEDPERQARVALLREVSDLARPDGQ